MNFGEFVDDVECGCCTFRFSSLKNYLAHAVRIDFRGDPSKQAHVCPSCGYDNGRRDEMCVEAGDGQEDGA